NEELGNDPDLPTAYDVARINSEASVPGQVNPGESVGVLNNPMNIPPQSVAPPPGVGSGSDGGPESERPGAAPLFGEGGGHNGRLFAPGGPGGRSAGTRERLLREGGGNTASEAAVAGGLSWLARHQFADGHWSMTKFHEANKCSCGNP